MDAPSALTINYWQFPEREQCWQEIGREAHFCMPRARPEKIHVVLEYDPREMANRGRIGAHRLHASHDSKELTKPARAAFMARFEWEVDPDRMLSDDERARRAGHARKAYFARLALLSAKARRAKRGQIAAVSA